MVGFVVSAGFDSGVVARTEQLADHDYIWIIAWAARHSFRPASAEVQCGWVMVLMGLLRGGTTVRRAITPQNC
jgi:hypothetical protein